MNFQFFSKGAVHFPWFGNPKSVGEEYEISDYF